MDEKQDGQLDPKTGTPTGPGGSPVEAWRRGRESVKNTLFESASKLSRLTAEANAAGFAGPGEVVELEPTGDSLSWGDGTGSGAAADWASARVAGSGAGDSGAGVAAGAAGLGSGAGLGAGLAGSAGAGDAVRSGSPAGGFGAGAAGAGVAAGAAGLTGAGGAAGLGSGAGLGAGDSLAAGAARFAGSAGTGGAGGLAGSAGAGDAVRSGSASGVLGAGDSGAGVAAGAAGLTGAGGAVGLGSGAGLGAGESLAAGAARSAGSGAAGLTGAAGAAGSAGAGDAVRSGSPAGGFGAGAAGAGVAAGAAGLTGAGGAAGLGSGAGLGAGLAGSAGAGDAVRSGSPAGGFGAGAAGAGESLAAGAARFAGSAGTGGAGGAAGLTGAGGAVGSAGAGDAVRSGSASGGFGAGAAGAGESLAAGAARSAGSGGAGVAAGAAGLTGAGGAVGLGSGAGLGGGDSLAAGAAGSAGAGGAAGLPGSAGLGIGPGLGGFVAGADGVAAAGGKAGFSAAAGEASWGWPVGGDRGGGRAPRQLPEAAGGWAAPIELQPGVHYKSFTLPPGYVPGYPVPPGQSNEGEEEGPGLLEYWRLLRRRKGTVFLIAAAGLILAILITLPMTPIYTAKAWIEIQQTNDNFLNMKDVQQISPEGSGYMLMTDIQTHIRVLQSLSLLDRVTSKFKELPSADQDGVQAVGRISAWRRALNLPEVKPIDQRATALSMARGSVKVRAQGQTRIIEITTDSTDKQLAAEYVNTLATEFIDQNMEARWQQTQKTGEWLTRQLDEMKIKLERSEDQLQDYARKSGLLFTDEKSSVSEERLKQLQQALSTATAERVAKQSRFEMAKNASPETLPDVINDNGLRELQSKLNELQRQSAELRATYNDKYPKLQRIDPQVRWLEGQFQRERAAILARIHNENTEALRKETLLRVDYETQAKLVRDDGEKGVHYNILKREVDSNRRLYESMLQRVKEASLAGAIKASNIRVVDPARIPGLPSRPSLPMNAALGLLTGLFIGVAFVVTTDKANKTFRDPGDIQFYLNLPELGVIPSEKAQVGSYARRKLKAAVHNDKMLLAKGAGAGELTERIELTVHQQKSSMLAESFRATLTSILFTGQNGQKPKALVVTSSGPGEGKSTVVSNLAAALGEIHQRVLLIDADTRKPRQHEIYGVPNDAGLTTLLLDQRDPSEVDLEGVILPTRVPGVFIMPAGPAVAAVTNLLYSGRMEQYLELLTGLFDVVLIDTPPMLQIPDARVLGRMAGGVVLVMRTGKTTRDAAMAVRQRLQEDGTKILGTVLNDWNPKASPGGYYGYTQGYYQSYKGYYGAKKV